MAASATGIGYGMTLTFSGISGELLNVNVDGISRDMTDATHSGSADGWKEFIGGLKDGGTVTATFQASSASGYGSAFEASSAGALTFSLPAPISDTLSANAWLQSYSRSASVADKVTITATFKITGKPTWA